MTSLAFRMVGNREDARDIVQEAFVRYWKAAYSLEICEAAFGLLSRITMNLSIDHLRKRRWRSLFLPFESVGYELADGQHADRNLNAGELRIRIEAFSHKLKPKQKACFVMRDMEDRPIEEIARIMGCSENNVKVNLCLARKNMRKWLAPFLKDEV